MKGRIALEIETRNESQGCSFNCPFLGMTHDNLEEYQCNLFGLLTRPPGWKCPRRARRCVDSQIPFDDRKRILRLRPKKLAPNKAPTAWERINGRDKL
jgi:hypothetical protein